MKNKDFDRTKQYCLKKDYNTDTLSHAWHCDGDFDVNSWNEIDNAEFFDIKLCTDIPLESYETIIEKIKDISQNKFIWLHFSNDANQSLNSEMINKYWKLIKTFCSSVDFGIEFEHKLIKGDVQKFNTTFFNDIINFARSRKLSWIKLYQLDKNQLSTHLYYHKNEEIILDKSHESCILE